MNNGYVVAVLGFLCLIVGAGMYLAVWHKTIGLGLVGLGIILIVLGIWYSRRPAAPATQPTQPSQPAQPKQG